MRRINSLNHCIVAVAFVLFTGGMAYANGSETGHENGNGHDNGSIGQQQQVQAQYQAQQQSQQQGQQQTAIGVGYGGQGGFALSEGSKAYSGGSYSGGNKQQTTVTVEGDEQERINPPQITTPYMTQLIQNGRIGDFTSELPMFAAIKPLNKKTDVVLEVVDIFYGWFMDRIRLEDVERDLLAKCSEVSYANGGLHNIRYQVWFKDAATSGGIGGGMAGNAANNSGVGGVFSILPGKYGSNADPLFVIKFFKIQ